MPTKLPRKTTKRSYAGLSSEVRVTTRRLQFIEAGKKLFGTLGYHRTTVRLLCQEAELTDRYFYESFPSIEDLLVTIYELYITELEQTIIQALVMDHSTPVEERIRLGLDAFFRRTEDPMLSRVLWIEILGVSPGAEAVYNKSLRRFADLLFNLSKALLPDWPISDAVAKTACMGVIGAASETAKSWLLANYEQPRATLVEGMMLIFRGLVNLAQSSK
ncbi:MAG: TetR/AcrR family transcriptional regulator [Moraxellaceae bacterium]|nr:TetR/AcrR family transcriptional regulator [Moraxellaceae bacterium]MDZ4387698.1 TetR/AcrR family transcriptional regulator [Moraxellaceae bacterium]